jgi:hypothetical protein
MLRNFLFFIAIITSFAALSQKKKGGFKMDPVFEDSIRNIEYQLEGLSHNIINSKDVQERRTSNYYFVQTLKKALAIPQSFYYDFKLIKTVSIIRSPDDKFRVFTWNLIEDSGLYCYFGAIQMNHSDKVIIHGLYDSTEKVRDPFYSELTNREWLGALYYQMHHYTYKKQDYYIVFGWNGRGRKTHKKIIDVLWFDENDEPRFGADIFDFEGDIQKRLIFEFSTKAVMLARYDTEEEAIVFSNMVPLTPMLKGRFESYVPDGTYDFMRLDKGIWRRTTALFKDRNKNAHLFKRE